MPDGWPAARGPPRSSAAWAASEAAPRSAAASSTAIRPRIARARTVSTRRARRAPETHSATALSIRQAGVYSVAVSEVNRLEAGLSPWSCGSSVSSSEGSSCMQRIRRCGGRYWDAGAAGASGIQALACGDTMVRLRQSRRDGNSPGILCVRVTPILTTPRSRPGRAGIAPRPPKPAAQ